MRYIIALFYFVAFQSPVYAGEDKTLKLLLRDLGDALEIHGENEIRYCPDNTCDLYKIKNNHPDFSIFIYLHLFHESGYIYLNESIGGYKAFRKIAVEEPDIRASAAHYCKAKPVKPKCILKGMRKKLGISVGFGRYDEGYFCFGYSKNESTCKKL